MAPSSNVTTQGGNFTCAGSPDPEFPGLVGGNSNETCDLHLPNVKSWYTGEWKVWALFSNTSFYNLTTTFQLVTTSRPTVNFTESNETPLEVKVDSPFQITCHAYNGRPMPSG